MPPQNQNPYPPAPAVPPSNPDQTRYDFFLNPPPKPRRALFAGGSLKQRLIVVGGGIILIIILFFIATALLKPKGNFPALLSVAQDQNEIVRISGEASQDAVDQATKNLAMTAELSLTTDQQNLVAYIAKAGHKVSTKQLALKTNKTTDTTLANAAAASNFDAVYDQTMQTELQAYENDLQTAYKATTGPNGRKLLQTDFANAKLLLTQIPSQTTSQ